MVGSAILKKLQNEGYTNLVYQTSKELDLRRQDETEKFFEKERPEFVINAAAKVGGIVANSTFPAEFIYDNLMISSNLIHSSYVFGVKKLINLGSSCIYPKNAPIPIKEEYLLSSEFEKTNEAYALAKVSALKICEFYNKQYGTDFITLMPPNLYGENDNFNLQTGHVIPMLVRRFHLAKLFDNGDVVGVLSDLTKNPIGWGLDEKINDLPVEDILKNLGIKQGVVSVWGDGSVYREFMASEDVADACLYFLKNVNSQQLGNFVNLATGKDILMKELVNLIKNVVGYGGEIFYDKSKPNGVYRKLLDDTKISAFGWKPTISLHYGVENFYKYYVENFS